MKNWGIETDVGPLEGGYLEFYSPKESRSPKPGTPLIRVDPKTAEREDLESMMFGDALHYAPEVDPRINQWREDIRGSLSDGQLSRSRGRYTDYTSPESKYYNPRENRSYEDWFENSDLDAIIRGYMTGQWGDKGYPEKQRFIMDAMKAYLGGKLGK